METVLIDGQWRAASATGTFRAENPATRQPLAPEFPVSGWQDCDAALTAAVEAHERLKRLADEPRAAFLERFAERIERRAADLVETAHAETALPKTPRLADVELPRTTGQLRKAADAARDGSWRMATIDRAANIRSAYASIGPVCVFGPNNFPFAFGSTSGGDFAAAIAAGNPVIAKANTSHPGTTRIFAEEAHAAASDAGLPAATVQLLYRTSHADGARLVSDLRTGATGYTGSRAAGLALKAAADAAGKPIYLELSSVNPVVILPGAIDERCDKIVEEYATSCLMGTGQFCTNPGVIVLLKGPAADRFTQSAVQKFQSAPVGTLLSKNVNESLSSNVQKLKDAGAEVLLGGGGCEGDRYCYQNTLLRIGGRQFLAHPQLWQTEMFGNASLLVMADDVDQAARLLDELEGNLTGCIYSDTGGKDDAAYEQIASHLRPRVGRLLNDKMPTGVAVSTAMNHGGPFPATGHPGFTAVGLPASMLRFAMLQCYDNVRAARRPSWLGDKNPNGKTWRLIDGAWTQGDANR
jgi:NADP-dependent aldehyde dehydrogenase